MAEGAVQDLDARTERGLTYPGYGIPGPAEAVTVAPGVLWLRMALPLALDHINVYALEDGEGWTLVDTGLSTQITHESWEKALTGPLGGKPVKRVICTHMHPDHIGVAGWLCARFGAGLMMSRLEYVTARMLLADTGQPAPEVGTDFYRAAGFTDEQISDWKSGYGNFGQVVGPLPLSYERLSEGQIIPIGDYDWQVVIGEGHSPEHVCLWRKSDGVFLAGDQILPRISSNISVWVTEPAADPLGDWLQSLHRLLGILPSDLFVLPAHGEPFYGVSTRLEALIRGHEVALKRLERKLKSPCRAVDVFASLFARPIGKSVLTMATGEAIAHLNYLERQGRVRREKDADGVDWWTLLEDSE